MAKQTFTTGQVLTAAQMTSLQQTAMGGGAPVTKTTSYVLTAADAGTTIQMNSASSTTITVNTALFAAGDSVQIQNIGTGSITITAGTATVNTSGSLALTQWEGGFLYFTSTSSAIFFDYTQTGLTNPMTNTGDIIYSSSGSTPARLGIGSTGNVLTVSGGVPVWSAPAGGGKVLQVVMGTTSTSTTIASTTFTDTSLTASITPSSTSSKVLVFYAQQYKSFRGQSTQGVGLQLVRGSTAIQIIGGAKYAAFTWDGVSTGGAEFRTVTTSTYLDSPSTTSSTTYKVQGGVLYTSNSGEMVCQNDSPSTIILMEIGA